jgi:pimeloyl-ACP methyl ester carboxylesterase
MSRTSRVSAVLSLALLLTVRLRAEEPFQVGTVFVVGGIGGLDPIQGAAPWALRRAGVLHKIEVFEWTHGKCRLLRDLQDTSYLLGKADDLADTIRATLAREPGAPIYLVGHSAGAGLVLAAAERLPPGSLERIVLLSAAVSPSFNLVPALRATRHEIVSFSSVCDRFCLDWGTSLFGTVDRVYGPSAGLHGFTIPPYLDAEGKALYDRLVQVPWRWQKFFQFGAGTHHSPCMPSFLANQVAPWLMLGETSSLEVSVGAR